MSLSGSLPLSQIPPQDLNTLNLQNQERISAEVLQVAGERVYLSIDGVRVVARLTSSDQAARLMEKRRANFVVKDSSPKEILLQLVGGESSEQDPAASPINLIPELLIREGLAQDSLNTQLAQALLNHGLPVQAELIRSLREFLNGHHLTGEQQVAAAVALLAQGLQLSPGIFALLMEDLPHLGTLLKRYLKDQKMPLSEQPADPKLPRQSRAGSGLEQLVVKAQSTAEANARELRRALPLLIKSLESDLLEKIQGNPGPASREKTSRPDNLSLLNLLPEPSRQPGQGREQILEQLLGRLRLTHYANSQADENPGTARWLHVELPIHFPGSPEGSDLKTAYLKINSPYQESRTRDHPQQLNLQFNIRLDQGDLISVDLNLFKENIRGSIQASSPHLRSIAEAELDKLKQQLSAGGYRILGFQCSLNESLTFPDHPLVSGQGRPASSRGHSYQKINVEA
jgi:hypothetical protein